MWVEQPVGVSALICYLSTVIYSFYTLQTGFSQGTPDISNDDGLAAEVLGFLEQFLEVFRELKGSNFFVSGESVRGVILFLRKF